MTMEGLFKNLDSVEKTVFIVNNDFRVKLRVNVSSKSYQGNRLDGDYHRSYNSNYYNNRSNRNDYILNTSEYLVFSYFRKEDEQFINEDIFLSYPNIYPLYLQLSAWLKELNSVKDKVYVYDETNNTLDLDQGYVDELSLLLEDFPGDKTLLFRPGLFVTKDNYIEEGVEIFFNSTNKFTVTSLTSFANLVHGILKGFNLLQSSLTLVSIAATNEMYNQIQGTSNHSGPENQSNNNSGGGRPLSSLAPRTRRKNLNRRGNTQPSASVKPKIDSVPKRTKPNITNTPFGDVPNDDDLPFADPIEDTLDEVDQTVEDMFSGVSKEIKEEEPISLDEEDNNINPESGGSTTNLLAASLGEIKDNAKKIHEDIKEGTISFDDIDKLD